MIRCMTAACAALLLAAPALAGAAEQLPRGLARLSPDDFARSVAVADGPLVPHIVLSTQSGYKGGQSMSGAYADDVHLKALIDRQSGRVSWQVWHDLINFHGKGEVAAIDYLAAGAPRSSAPVKVERWQEMCSAGDTTAPCHPYMRVVFEVPETVVQEMAAAYRAGSREPWRLRFRDGKGRDMAGGVAPAEAVGLLRSVDEWRARQGRSVL